MNDIVEGYKILEGRIVEAQGKLRQRKKDDPLLGLVTVDEIGVHWTAEFGSHYEGMTAHDGLDKYIGDLEEASM